MALQPTPIPFYPSREAGYHNGVAAGECCLENNLVLTSVYSRRESYRSVFCDGIGTVGENSEIWRSGEGKFSELKET